MKNECVKYSFWSSTLEIIHVLDLQVWPRNFGAIYWQHGVADCPVFLSFIKIILSIWLNFMLKWFLFAWRPLLFGLFNCQLKQLSFQINFFPFILIVSLTLQSIWRCISNTCLIEKCCHKQQKYLSFWFFCIVTLTACLSSFMMEKVNLKSCHFNIFGSCVKRGTTKFFTVNACWFLHVYKFYEKGTDAKEIAILTILNNVLQKIPLVQILKGL